MICEATFNDPQKPILHLSQNLSLYVSRWNDTPHRQKALELLKRAHRSSRLEVVLTGSVVGCFQCLCSSQLLDFCVESSQRLGPHSSNNYMTPPEWIPFTLWKLFHDSINCPASSKPCSFRVSLPIYELNSLYLGFLKCYSSCLLTWRHYSCPSFEVYAVEVKIEVAVMTLENIVWTWRGKLKSIY